MIGEETRQAFMQIGLPVNEQQICAFETYYALLLEWNKKMNLTRITDPSEVAQKHFADSVLPLCDVSLPQGAYVIDVGTGAGFPGIPLKILRPDLHLVMLDSVDKRITFLNEVLGRLSIDAQTIHARAEDGGRSQLRDSFDVALSRAVASAPVLMELMLPFVKVGGKAICYKGPSARNDFAQAERAIGLLGGRLGGIIEKQTPWGARSLVFIEKVHATPKAYPRKAGTPSKQPILCK